MAMNEILTGYKNRLIQKNTARVAFKKYLNERYLKAELIKRQQFTH